MRLLKNANLNDIQVDPWVYIYRKYEELDQWGFGRTLEKAVASKIICSEERDDLLTYLTRASKDDRFFYSVTAFVVTAVKP